MNVLVNQLGYDVGATPVVVVRGEPTDDPERVRLETADDGDVVATASLERVGHVDDWRDWVFWTATLPPLETPGEYVAAVPEKCERDDGRLPAATRSRRFRVGSDLLRTEVLPDVLSYFRVERCTGQYDRADRRATFAGDREDVVDVRGGWYDASGDVSKYLSHLHYATYANPQQIPLVVWSLLDASERLGGPRTAEDGADPLDATLADGAREEALFGADFLVRAQDDAGYFYTTVFDGWTGDPEEREICAFEGFDGERTDAYEAGLRQGGGMAIAALARASVLAGGDDGIDPTDDGNDPTHDGVNRKDDGADTTEERSSLHGAFDAETYRQTAVEGFDHLRANNEAYLNDGTENLLDDYCGLLAAIELARATGEQRFADAAAERSGSILDRQTGDGWFAADDAGERPFFHATDEGLPIVALCRFLALLDPTSDAPNLETTGGARGSTPALPQLDEPTLFEDVRAAIAAYWRFELALTDDVVNPFGYARQYARAVDEAEPSGRFFVPHDNETGYWWLGENARICSLASAALHTAETIDPIEATSEPASVTTDDLTGFARDQLDWILGRNPFDTSMFQGVGQNPRPFVPSAPQTPGGIVNGVTAHPDDESDVAFLPDAYADDFDHTWRWTEQWLPHAAWFLFAATRLAE